MPDQTTEPPKMDLKVREFYDNQMNFLLGQARGIRCGLFLLSLDEGAIPESSLWAKFVYSELLKAAQSISKFLPPEPTGGSTQ